jgi:hypothetical protein
MALEGSFGELEDIFAKAPGFGDSNYIRDQLHASHERRLCKVADRLPVAGQLLEALEVASTPVRYRVIGDPIVRCAIQHAFVQLETGARYGLTLDDCEDVLRAAVLHVRDGNSLPPLAAGLTNIEYIGPESYHGWVWTENRPKDVFTEAFRYVIQREYGEFLTAPDSDQLATLVKATSLLGVLLPKLSPSALSHTHVIALFPPTGTWRGKGSSSQYRLSGVIFLNGGRLRNPWWVAEHLLHESLHQKLYDFRAGHSLLQPNYSRNDAPKVSSLWNTSTTKRTNRWDVDRVLAAFHVYVHLAFFCAMADSRATELESSYGPKHSWPHMTETRQALERAHYLGEKLRQVCWTELGPAGKSLVDWLASILEVYDSAPPPAGSYVHLLLDLYHRQAETVESAVSKHRRSVPPEFSSQLAALSIHETDRIRQVLLALGAETKLREFDSALVKYSYNARGAAFPQVRRLILDTLQDVSPDGYRLPIPPGSSEDPNQIVKQMVESSSQRLDEILLGWQPWQGRG